MTISGSSGALPALGSPEYWDPDIFMPQMKVKYPDRSIGFWRRWSHMDILSAAVKRAYAEHKGVVHLKARREGSTTFFTGLAYQHAAAMPGTWAACLGYKKESAQGMSDMVMRYHQYAPPLWKPPRRPGKKRELILDVIDSKVTIHSVKDDEPLRGDGVHFLLANEISSWDDSKAGDAWIAARSALTDEGGFLVADSTGRRSGDPMHELWQEAHEPGAPWVHVFIPWTLIERYKRPPPPGWQPHPLVAEYRDAHDITDAQACWMHEVGLPKCKYDIGKFMAEYPYIDAEPFLGTGESIFDTRVLTRTLRDLDAGTGILDPGEELAIFEKAKPGHTYVIGVDPSGGWSERDYMGVVVLDVTDCEQVAELRAHKGHFWMAQELIRLSALYNNAMIYVEANAIGEAVLSHLIVTNYPHVYWRRERGMERPKPGVHSNTATRAEAVDIAQEIIRDESIRFRSPRLVRQLLAYRGPGAQRDKQKGHFDLVTAFLWCAYAYRREAFHARRAPTNYEGMQLDRLLDEFAGRFSSPGSMTTTSGRNTPWGAHR